MKLVANWRAIASRSYSMWALYLSAVCLIAPTALYELAGLDTDPLLWGYLGLGLLLFGISGRLIDQGVSAGRARRPLWIVLLLLIIAGVWTSPDWRDGLARDSPTSPPVELSLQDPVSVPDVGVLASDKVFLARAVPFIGGWEGLRLKAYLDIVGNPTVCYGETRGVQLGDSYTRAECDAMFAPRILEFRDAMQGYFSPDTLAHRLPLDRELAFVDLAYNVGKAGAGRSTATKRLNAGRVAAACDALTWWNKAGGRVVRGLVRRRGGGYDLCMVGVT